MAFINAILDEAVSYGFEGGPEYSTEEVDLENSLQIRNAAWQYPRHRYSASFENIPDDAREYIIEVFHACRGKLHSFMFKDWNDYQITAQPLVVPVGTAQPAQFYKIYQFGEAYTVRPIQAVDADSLVLVDDTGAAVAGTLDPETGMFVPATAWDPARTYFLTCDFYVWVHFTDDYNSVTINGWRNHTANVDMEEDKRKLTATNVPRSWEA